MPMTMHRRRSLLVAGVTAAVVVLAGPAAAQEDPYGSTTTTAGASGEATIEIEVGPDGASVGIYACGYRPGEGDEPVEGQLTIDGEVVLGGLRVGAEGCLVASSLAGPGEPDPTGPPVTVPISDEDDPDDEPDEVCAVVAGWNTPCADHPNGDGTDAAVGGSDGSSGVGEGSDGADVAGVSTAAGEDRILGLPATGVAAGVMVVMGIILVVVGRGLLQVQRFARR